VSPRTNPQITVITVNRNDYKGLVKTARSICEQENSNFDWLVIDGQSTDRSREFISELQQHEGFSFISSPPKGIYNAMNVGVMNAKSDWVWFLNSGDFFLSNTSISTMLEIIRNNEFPEVIATPVFHFTALGFVHDISEPATIDIGDYKLANFNHQGVIAMKSAIEQVGGFDENLQYASDGKLLDSLVASTSWHIENSPLVGFSLGGRSSRNYKLVLREIETFRPSIESKSIRYIKILKNFVRLLILDHEQKKFSSIFVRNYFQRREKRIFKNSSEYSSQK
jgi:glycosyltransferase involved in cell wall biosynthesis